MWFFMHESGIHATIAGVVLAFAFPFLPRSKAQESPMARLESALHKPVAFAILPIFAFANAGVAIGGDAIAGLLSPNGMGIMHGISSWQIYRRLCGQLLCRQSRFGSIVKRHQLEARHGCRPGSPASVSRCPFSSPIWRLKLKDDLVNSFQNGDFTCLFCRRCHRLFLAYRHQQI